MEDEIERVVRPLGRLVLAVLRLLIRGLNLEPVLILPVLLILLNAEVPIFGRARCPVICRGLLVTLV
jgi:hypothetical protein